MISTQINSKNTTKKTTNSPRFTVFQLPVVTTLQATAILKLTLWGFKKKHIYLKIV